MSKKPVLTLGAFALGISLAVAQQPSTEEVDARIQALRHQRDTAMDQVVVLQARLVILDAQLKGCKKE